MEFMNRYGDCIDLDEIEKRRKRWQPREIEEEDMYIFETEIQRLERLTKAEILKMKGE